MPQPTNLVTPDPKMASAVDEYKNKQKDLQTNYDSRSKLTTQLEENQTVQREFALLEKDGVVYKLVGPVLVKQNLDDAKANVEKRLTYIKDEVSRADKVIGAMETELEDMKNKLQKMIQASQGGGESSEEQQ